MPRVHLFELEDQSWFPAIVRDAATAYLRFGMAVSGHARGIAPALAQAIGRTGAKRIVDLCSGGAGPIPSVVEALDEAGLPARVLLTDRYPNLDAFRWVAAQSQGRIEFMEEPVDATAVPPALDGFRTFFNAFHHFRPEVARRILQSAADDRQPIGVFEFVGRAPMQLLGVLISPLLLLLAVPFLRPFRWSWIPLTYLVPVIPLMTLWDGVVSCLRVYSIPELQEMVAGISTDGYGYRYDWEIGRIRLGPGVHCIYLLGIPSAVEPGGES
ncbi:MAG: hypothetical protein O7A09_13030 [Proteobacteria bacterium]|nr:hypothetical protein [Pseudomonadota bacterium]MCZ6784121.1 hypothetical protein [Pseudomonadota bacterium]